MKNLLIFAGTTEGRKLSEYLADAGIVHTVCVATEYGEIVLKDNPIVNVHRGRMEQKEIKDFIRQGNYFTVIDATHPYAEIVTRNIKTAIEELNSPESDSMEYNSTEYHSMEYHSMESEAAGMGILYFRLKREKFLPNEKEGITFFDTAKSCAEALERTEGNILLTTGSKELPCYCVSEEVKKRLYVRVLPSVESISLCMEQGICGKQIIAMQGPFTTAMNEAMLVQYGISVLVTKESGGSGGFTEKLEAARKAGTAVFVIGCPKDQGYSFCELCRKIESIYRRKICNEEIFQITLAGVGMGSRNGLTKEVQDAVREADILLGAERMLASYQAKLEKRPIYQAEQIISYLKERQRENLPRKIVVLFSGDSGFYSGCQRVHDALTGEIRSGGLKASLRVLPGISSVAALAASIGESYQDAAVYSMHGKELQGLVQKIGKNTKTFLLMSGVRDVNRLGELLEKADMGDCEVIVGYQLSYKEEQVRILPPKACCSLEKDGLYTCMVRNPHAGKKRLIHGRADGEFIRGKVPMTKEEIREISICKLRLCQGAVVYDIGSGTGSVAVELAGLSEELQVYAIEQKKEAASLIRANKEKSGLENITVVEAKAPEGIRELPAPTHVFIGGSGGCLKGILNELYRRSPGVRVVVNAASMETICEIRECLADFEIQDAEIVQVQVNRVKEMGNYHLTLAENPVWICTFHLGVCECG